KGFELITKPAQPGKPFFNIKEARLLHSAIPSIKTEERESQNKPQNQRFFDPSISCQSSSGYPLSTKPS
ncbi:hypothetical protein, partial [Gluconobacter sphaericus]|uniref:hypothetical protein n=1 Tax=Gluconobacter sphaericus TaxID=574987 RepID=UPI001C3FCD8F